MSLQHLFEVTDPTITQLWDRILTSQVDFSIGLELSWYYTFPEWHRARTVLDLGTGNGDYLARLARQFAGKSYLGVDLSTELIAIARRDHSSGSVSFECRDLFATKGRYDFIILRATVQHVPELSRLVAHLAALLADGGAAMIIDSDDHMPFFCWPAVPTVTALFDDLVKAQVAAKSIEGGTLNSLVRMIEASDLLDLVSDTTTVIPTTIDANRDRLKAQFRMVFQLLKRTGAVTADYLAVEREWEDWCRLEHAYADTRTRTICLTKRSRRNLI